MSKISSKNPVAVVTGASRGIGKAVAINFARRGYDVALIARTEATLNQVSEIISKQYPVKTGIFPLDCGNKTQINEAVDHIAKNHGQIDVLFNNAGISYAGTVETKPEQFDAMIQVNLCGYFYFIHAIAPIMKQQRSGYIFNVASYAGKFAMMKSGTYSASKFGVVGLSYALFQEMLPYGVKVTTLCPSVIDTDMTAKFKDFPHQEKIRLTDVITAVNFLLDLGPTATVKELDILNPYIEQRRNSYCLKAE